MIKFLFKGLIRDRHRSLLPVIVVAIGVFLTVLCHSWITGILGDGIELNARFSTGHVKIMTVDYKENRNQTPNDAALLGADSIIQELNEEYPDMIWAERIRFGGLLDAPDEHGETKAQGPAIGFGIDMLSGNKEELERMNISQSLKKGRIPKESGEVLISDQLLIRLKSELGDTITLIGSTMNNDFAIYNFKIVGTVVFGTTAMDRGAIVADINDVRTALDMHDAVGEILGYFKSGFYDNELAMEIKNEFNKRWTDEEDIFSPTMLCLKEQDNMSNLVDFASKMASIIIIIFMFAMSIVLWNAGLIGGLRRYSEYGLRLAIGEGKNHVFRTMIYESLMIGIIGTIIGTAIGLSLAFYLQNNGIDFSSFMENATIMMPSVYKARVTDATWFIGFIPGVLSTLLGTILSAKGIYKRKTAQLFKELEA